MSAGGLIRRRAQGVDKVVESPFPGQDDAVTDGLFGGLRESSPDTERNDESWRPPANRPVRAWLRSIGTGLIVGGGLAALIVAAIWLMAPGDRPAATLVSHGAADETATAVLTGGGGMSESSQVDDYGTFEGYPVFVLREMGGSQPFACVVVANRPAEDDTAADLSFGDGWTCGFLQPNFPLVNNYVEGDGRLTPLAASQFGVDPTLRMVQMTLIDGRIDVFVSENPVPTAD